MEKDFNSKQSYNNRFEGKQFKLTDYKPLFMDTVTTFFNGDVSKKASNPETGEDFIEEQESVSFRKL